MANIHNIIFTQPEYGNPIPFNYIVGANDGSPYATPQQIQIILNLCVPLLPVC